MSEIDRNPIVIAGEQALANFREGLTGPFALDLLAAATGGVLAQLPVGVGKTVWMTKIITHAVTTGGHDLVVVLVPRWDILRELLDRLPTDLHRVVLAPRPQKRCGDLNETWMQYEQHGLGFLGKAQLCSSCPHFGRCPWPGQYGRRLRGEKLILATQQHLNANPSFLLHLQQMAGAKKPLLLIDESNLIIRSMERTIRANDLQRFIAAQQAHVGAAEKTTAAEREWLELSQLLPMATSEDLREGKWKFPFVDAEWATSVQRHGLNLFDQAFQFLAFDIHRLAHSDRASREKLAGGDIRFASVPYLGNDFIVFSGSMAKELVRYRLDPDHSRDTLASPFESYRFSHPATKWFNINDLAGASKYFRGNANRILDFFAAKIANNIADGKRTLLVSKKSFIPLCRRLLREKLAKLGVGKVEIAIRNWAKYDLADPRVIGLINYGVAGINRFEQVDCAYCLNSYYVTPDVVSMSVQDIEATTERYVMQLEMIGEPRRRRVKVELPDGRMPALPRIAQMVLEQVEADAVVQAVGRVRPFTKPREVITFQADTLPGVDYTLEFKNLDQTRAYFEIRRPAEAKLQIRIATARRMKAQGCTNAEIMECLSISRATVKRYINGKGAHETF